MTKKTAAIRWLLILVLAAAATPGFATSEQDRTSNDLVGLFLWKVAGYVKWPKEAFENPRSALVIGVVGNEDLALTVKELVRGRDFEKRPFKIDDIRLIDFRTPTQVERFEERLRRCHIVYISAKDRVPVERVLELLENSTILTVSDSEAFARDDGIIELIVEVGKPITFHINRTNTTKAKLHLSSDLLDHAAKLYPEKK